MFLSLIFALLTTMQLGRAIDCFDCTNFPLQITCTPSASCEGVGCYFVLNRNSSFWKASCSNFISITDRQTSCYKIPDGNEFCVCFSEFCNTPIEIERAVDLRYTPFTTDPDLPWHDSTLLETQTHISPTHASFIDKVIPTTLLFGKISNLHNNNNERPGSTSAVAQNRIGKPTAELSTTTSVALIELRINDPNLSVTISNSSEPDGSTKLNESSSVVTTSLNINKPVLIVETTTDINNLCPSTNQNKKLTMFLLIMHFSALCMFTSHKLSLIVNPLF